MSTGQQTMVSLPPSKQAPPNILWISFEDTSPFYGCYGDPVARTPGLDRLAAEGTLYENAFSTAPVCAPARCAVITGAYATTLGAHHMRTTHTSPLYPDLPTPYEAVPPPDVRCFSEFLRHAGYYCTNRIKTDYQFNSPFTAWDELSMHAHWRNRPQADQPFFAVFNYEESHESGAWEDSAVELLYNPDDVPVPPYLPDTPKIRECLARVYSHIEHNDRRLSKLLDQLEEDGLAENTIVVHWSDHGPLPRGKRCLYDSGIHVPLIIRWPEHIRAGAREKRLVSTLDLAPTMLSLAGLPIPPYMQGQVFLGENQDIEREVVFATRDRMDTHYDRIRAVRSQRYKYIRNYHPFQPALSWISYLTKHPIMQEMQRLHLNDKLEPQHQQLFSPQRPAEELYDLQCDPNELSNLAEDPNMQPILHDLRHQLDTWVQETGDLGALDEAEMVRHWWPEKRQPKTSPPFFLALSETEHGTIPIHGEAELQTPCRLQLFCQTQGASLAYQFADDPREKWHLYTEPIALDKGRSRVRAKAIRLGYLPSEVREVSVHVFSPEKSLVVGV